MYLNKYNKVSAIIAEYNPLHKGHEFQIQSTKDVTGSDYVIAIMSGDFTQRGTPAIINKYIRTQMALNAGIDLVIELPAIYATSSAQGFARGAVSILNALNCVNCLSFGSESGDISKLISIAKLLNSDEDHIDSIIKSNIKSGLSFPGLFSNAAGQLTHETSVLNYPNNILGIEYIRAILRYDSPIIPITVPRNDNGFNSETINSSLAYASAKSIRNSMYTHNDEYKSYVPTYVSDLIPDKLVHTDDFSDLLYYKLLSEKSNGFGQYLDVNEELSNKIVKYLPMYKDISSFIMFLKSKNLTHARISRALYHILLNIKYDDISFLPKYARVLGFRKESKELLGIIKSNSEIKLITKLADAPAIPSLMKDIYCADIYERIAQTSINEYKQSPIIL